MRRIVLLAGILSLSLSLFGAEEKIRGVLEKTTKGGACAQITDALADVYYITKTDEAEKAIASYVGKNEKVVITGTVENKEGDTASFFNLKTVEAYNPKMPPAPPPPPPPPPVAKPEEKKDEAKAPDTKPAETKPAETKPAEKK
ncbi:MAG TPA: hypothetical protein VGP72_23570 [Planctomycetota bacterium]